MNDNEDIPEMVRRMQACSDGYAKGEVELKLADQPRLYRLPKCTTAGLITHTPNKVELLLDTEGDHRFLIELEPGTAETLYNLLDFALKGPHP